MGSREESIRLEGMDIVMELCGTVLDVGTEIVWRDGVMMNLGPYIEFKADTGLGNCRESRCILFLIIISFGEH